MIGIRLKPLFNRFVPTLKIFIIAPDTTLMKLQTWHLKYQFLMIRVVIVKKGKCVREGGFAMKLKCLAL